MIVPPAPPPPAPSDCEARHYRRLHWSCIISNKRIRPDKDQSTSIASVIERNRTIVRMTGTASSSINIFTAPWTQCFSALP